MGSVLAFVTLRRELRSHCAPESLLRRTLAAAAEEVGHARRMMTLAKRYGARAPRARRASDFEVRPLVEIAIENASEGCVNETFSGLIARHQALHARDAGVRAALSHIAPEELEHAALAWDLHEWLLAQLTEPQKARVQRALRRALRRLPLAARKSELDETNRRLLGLPSAARTCELARRLATELVLARTRH
jgi:hypothetical protein